MFIEPASTCDFQAKRLPECVYRKKIVILLLYILRIFNIETCDLQYTMTKAEKLFKTLFIIFTDNFPTTLNNYYKNTNPP